MDVAMTADADRCEKCGEVVPIGGWFACKSKQNPEGHARGTYGFSMKFSMRTNGWTRREQ